MKKINYKLEIEVFRNSTQKIGCPEGFFLRVWVSKKAPRRPAGITLGSASWDIYGKGWISWMPHIQTVYN